MRALGAKVASGLKIRGVPTSDVTAALAKDLGIEIITLAEAKRIDTTFDGADEVAPSLDLIKGYGGALVREKIVATSSDRLVILVGDEKVVSKLGERGRLPVEIVPFGLALCDRKLRELGLVPTRREVDGQPYVTDNQNFILDCALDPVDDPAGFERNILAIPGVVGTGIFVGLADLVLVQQADGVRAMSRS